MPAAYTPIMSAGYTPWGYNQRIHLYMKITYIPNSYPRNRLVRVPEPPKLIYSSTPKKCPTL